MSKKRCLQEILGSCAGCNIMQITSQALNSNGTVRDLETAQLVAKPIQLEYCPTGNNMQIDKLLPDISASIL